MKEISIEEQLKDKGIRNSLLIEAFQDIPEAFFLSENLHPYFYEDIRIEKAIEKTEPRVIVVARMLEQLEVKEEEKILVIGVDSVYILAALSKIYKEVYTVETTKTYAEWALEVLKNIEVTNVHIKTGKLVNGWKTKGPFNAILSASEFKEVPNTIKQQLNIGAKLLAPVGPDWAHVMLEIIERTSETDFITKALRDNYFIPKPKLIPKIGTKMYPENEIIDEIGISSIPFKTIKKFPIDGLLERIGDAKVVLLGEASHGTSEFYAMRQEITKALIEKKGFNLVCAEADWSDAEQINNYVRNQYQSQDWMPFARFPEWMWKNREVLEFVEWLKKNNTKHNNTIGFYGLDLYGLENSIDLVIDYLEEIDSDLAALAKLRYSCIMPYMSNPTVYGKLVKNQKLESCEKAVLKMLFDLLKNKNKLNHSQAYFYAYQNATVVVDAERYYKAMYYGSAESWNLRDFHMFYTLKSLLSYHGKDSKAVVWAHNSHIGNALATEMYARGEINIGHLCKEHFGSKSYNIGFGTHTGTVAAAKNWGDAMQVMPINNSLAESYEHLCHKTNVTNFTLPLREQHSEKNLRKLLSTPRLERAIGVVYRPETELMSHYFKTVLPSQFDEYIWFNKTKAITPLKIKTEKPELKYMHPFGRIDK
ncbi:protein-L-isoaspartate(D-aspartate) O-methyltransferase [Winogradskyella pacifica]|uniref:Protein-L-isoaspartate(D-aspartate) O-methyltransferase n=1 Tax=Winogradskyella pacifica TaxID=664642 RepID=A0A3D9LJV8_9FLAO|nr:erythromycin esterase family protein [Winogradskyella pacifica]REE07679.1 protein-L-isoaspartate(D-aspartate) O-methyltransferase [Winogradskyella pacifica]